MARVWRTRRVTCLTSRSLGLRGKDPRCLDSPVSPSPSSWPRPGGGGTGHPWDGLTGDGPRGAARAVPRRRRRGADVPGLRQPPAARGLQARQRASGSPRCPTARSSSATSGCSTECEFGSIQTAINTIRKPNTSIYVLPGVYREQQWANQERSHYCSHLETESDDPLPAAEYIGSLSSPDPGTSSAAAEDDGTSDPIALSYADQRRCAHNLNLIAVFGDETPEERLHLLRQRVLRDPDRRHRSPDDRRHDRQPASRSSTPCGWTARAARWCAT